MRLTELRAALDAASLADEIGAVLADIFPLARSVTGGPNRATIDRLSELAPWTVTEVASGTPVLDWVVPDEWNVRAAWIADSTGRRLVDVADHPLHLVGYSRPFRGQLSRDGLDPHLHSLPDRPDLIPYRTGYYSDGWGFCLSERQRQTLGDGPFEVCVDVDLSPGSLTLASAAHPGESDEIVLVTTHLCHPAMANDNASGLAVIAVLNRLLAGVELRREHRLLVMPGTSGAITWLATHRDDADRVAAGLVLTGLGDPSPWTYKRSRAGDRMMDRAADAVLAGREARFVDFSPYGYDERQFCSPGFDLGVGRLTRGVHGEYPEYHTSGDDLAFVSTERMVESLLVILELLDAVERNHRPYNQLPHGEPQLGKRGLYSLTGGAIDSASVEMAYLWVLNLADGDHDLLSIAGRSGLSMDAIAEAARRLTEAGLLDSSPPD